MNKNKGIYIEIGFHVTSPWLAQELLKALTTLSGYSIEMSPRFPEITEILNDEEGFVC